MLACKPPLVHPELQKLLTSFGAETFNLFAGISRCSPKKPDLTGHGRDGREQPRESLFAQGTAFGRPKRLR
jgi:hypothetical protein